jgi:vacuolar protein 8
MGKLICEFTFSKRMISIYIFVEELLERMVQKGSVKSLLHLLTKSSDRDARRFSSVALANLSSAAFNRTRIASEGTVPILISMMKDADSDIVTRQFCAMALGNLAAEPDNHLEIVKSDGIEALLAVLKTDDVDAGRYAAFGLANIGANANHRDRIVELGAVPCLVSLACCEDINAQRQALAGLRSICISPEFRAVVVREGVMDPLVLLSRVEDLGILREVSSAINCLSSVEENKLEISDRCMSTVIGLMLSGDLVIERHSVCAAANLMEMLELHVKLSEERGKTVLFDAIRLSIVFVSLLVHQCVMVSQEWLLSWP